MEPYSQDPQDPEQLKALIDAFVASDDIPRTDSFANEEERHQWAQEQNLRQYIRSLREELSLSAGDGLDDQREHLRDELIRTEMEVAALQPWNRNQSEE